MSAAKRTEEPPPFGGLPDWLHNDWGRFLLHAMETGSMNRNSSQAPRIFVTSGRFSFVASQYPTQIRFFCLDADNSNLIRNRDDILRLDPFELPKLLDHWRNQITNAVTERLLTDFRTITTLTAILDFEP